LTTPQTTISRKSQSRAQRRNFAVPIERADWDSLVANDVGLQLRILEAAALAADEWEMEDVLTRLLDGARGLDPVPF
jgi:hypothetical protein